MSNRKSIDLVPQTMPNYVMKNASKVYKIIHEDIEIGGLEIIPQGKRVYIENVFIDVEHRNKGYLRNIINRLSSYYKCITCLPLQEHVEKFKHLGFRVWKQEGEDTYFIK